VFDSYDFALFGLFFLIMKHADPVHGPAYTVYGQNPTQPARGAVQRVGFHRFPGFHGFREAIAAGTLHER